MKKINRLNWIAVLAFLFTVSVPRWSQAQSEYSAEGLESYSVAYFDLNNQPIGGYSASNVPSSLSLEIFGPDAYGTLTLGDFSVTGGFVELDFGPDSVSGFIATGNPVYSAQGSFDFFGTNAIGDYGFQAYYGTYYEFDSASFTTTAVPEPSSISLATSGVLLISAFALARHFLKRKAISRQGALGPLIGLTGQ